MYSLSLVTVITEQGANECTERLWNSESLDAGCLLVGWLVTVGRNLRCVRVGAS